MWNDQISFFIPSHIALQITYPSQEKNVQQLKLDHFEIIVLYSKYIDKNEYQFFWKWSFRNFKGVVLGRVLEIPCKEIREVSDITLEINAVSFF